MSRLLRAMKRVLEFTRAAAMEIIMIGYEHTRHAGRVFSPHGHTFETGSMASTTRRVGRSIYWLRCAMLCALMQLASATPARADAVRGFVGQGQAADQYAVGIQLDRGAPIREYATSILSGHVEFGIGEFQGRKRAISHNTVKALAAIGMLRWQKRSDRSVVPFVDVGIGLGGLSEVTINGDRHFGGAFQFTEILRAGVRFGPQRRFELAIGAQHFSNAGLNRPNDGITCAGLAGAWYWR